MSSLSDKIQKDKIPNHIAIIMDGNGRWAKARSMTRLFGHHNGVKSVREVTECCARLGVKYLTLYTFSTENWSRPQEEVSGLMNLLIQTVGKELETLLKNNIRLQIIGDLSHLPGSTQNALRQAMEKTRDNQRMTLVLAINYSGRQEILNAITRITEEVRNGQLTWHEDESSVRERGCLRHGHGRMRGSGVRRNELRRRNGMQRRRVCRCVHGRDVSSGAELRNGPMRDASADDDDQLVVG